MSLSRPSSSCHATRHVGLATPHVRGVVFQGVVARLHLDDVNLRRASALVGIETEAGRRVARGDALRGALVGVTLGHVVLRRHARALVECPRPDAIGGSGVGRAAEISHQPKGSPEPRLVPLAWHPCGDLGDPLAEAELVAGLVRPPGVAGGSEGVVDGVVARRHQPQPAPRSVREARVVVVDLLVSVGRVVDRSPAAILAVGEGAAVHLELVREDERQHPAIALAGCGARFGRSVNIHPLPLETVGHEQRGRRRRRARGRGRRGRQGRRRRGQRHGRPERAVVPRRYYHPVDSQRAEQRSVGPHHNAVSEHDRVDVQNVRCEPPRAMKDVAIAQPLEILTEDE
eukprot:scaffold10280_cov64-Phaeocystis_antarctica.AAC.5